MTWLDLILLVLCIPIVVAVVNAFAMLVVLAGAEIAAEIRAWRRCDRR